MYLNCHFKVPRPFFVIEAEGFKFGVLGLLVAVFQKINCCISCMLHLIPLFLPWYMQILSYSFDACV